MARRSTCEDIGAKAAHGMSEQELTAYCVKCKGMRPIQDAAPVHMSNGRPATRGVCPACGTGLFKIGATPAHASLVKPEATTKKRVDKETRKQGNKEADAAPSRPAAPTSPSPSAPLTQDVQAYCVKCKAMRPMKDGRAIFMANGRPAAEGVCAECGTRLFRIGATADHVGLPQPDVETGKQGNKGARKQGNKETRKQSCPQYPISNI
ncbi:MAG: hypothetical protein CVU38_15205 [Chloroflexi bacterium HGW-Chloroflexi-1]|nr:MAG: hypothetical protein CVU38_15205 [Chloroflexi bacterium HGW-Chloroflexi-1]